MSGILVERSWNLDNIEWSLILLQRMYTIILDDFMVRKRKGKKDMENYNHVGLSIHMVA